MPDETTPKRGPGKPKGTKVRSDKRLGRPPDPNSIKEQGWPKLNLFLPPDLKQQLADRAKQDGTNMTQVIIEALKQYL